MVGILFLLQYTQNSKKLACNCNKLAMERCDITKYDLNLMYIIYINICAISQSVMRNLSVHLSMIFGRIEEFSLKLMISQKETNVSTKDNWCNSVPI